MKTSGLCLQDTYAPNSICFGCGPANKEGLQLKSYAANDRVITHFQPKTHHHAFGNFLSGGVIGAILDCHCNWTGLCFAMREQNLKTPPYTVTSQFTVKFLRPTPMEKTLLLSGKLEKIENNKIYVYGELIANEKVTATCDAIFAVVKEGHPGFHRW